LRGIIRLGRYPVRFGGRGTDVDIPAGMVRMAVNIGALTFIVIISLLTGWLCSVIWTAVNIKIDDERLAVYREWLESTGLLEESEEER